MSLLSTRASVLHLLSGRSLAFSGEFKSFYFQYLAHLPYVQVIKNEHFRRVFHIKDGPGLVKWWNERFISRLKPADRSLYQVAMPAPAELRPRKATLLYERKGTPYVGIS